MKFEKIKIEPFDDAYVIKPKVFPDNRGCFFESHNISELEKIDFRETFVQDNVSVSKKGVLRGLHYQWDNPLGKLVQVMRGSIRDVIVDMRKGSKTYGKHAIINIRDKDRKMVWAPEGYAHGFLSLENNTVVYYKYTAYYNKEGEGAVNPFDKSLNINWIMNKSEIIQSERDKVCDSFQDYDKDPKFFVGENK